VFSLEYFKVHDKVSIPQFPFVSYHLNALTMSFVIFMLVWRVVVCTPPIYLKLIFFEKISIFWEFLDDFYSSSGENAGQSGMAQTVLLYFCTYLCSSI
jgi:hypothetical protein